MLRRDKDAKQPTFADQTQDAQAAPEDHVLMQMKRAVDVVEAELARVADEHGRRLRDHEARIASLETDRRS